MFAGMDVDGELQVTNSFPFPTTEAPVQDHDGKHEKHDANSSAGAAPRSKANTFYQTEMFRCLREMNVDANSVGWYQSASLGNFVCSAPRSPPRWRDRMLTCVAAQHQLCREPVLLPVCPQ